MINKGKIPIAYFTERNGQEKNTQIWDLQHTLNAFLSPVANNPLSELLHSYLLHLYPAFTSVNSNLNTLYTTLSSQQPFGIGQAERDLPKVTHGFLRMNGDNNARLLNPGPRF